MEASAGVIPGLSLHGFKLLMLLLLLRERLPHSLNDFLLCGKYLFLSFCLKFSINEILSQLVYPLC